ncbi:MAG: hypothetical protein CMJ84_02545 [Planctomycetes bacterium]|jgi:hypothetical protein|nr:hypothetical protein [Planctomycetota bacterium]MDP6408382.1 hypothetical protein [Planctomycetota bacterium]
MAQTRRPLFSIALLVTALLAPRAAPQSIHGLQQARRAPTSAWGLRNLEFTTGPDPAAVFQPHVAGHVAFWLLWAELEPAQGAFDWSTLDARLDTVEALSAVPVVLLHLGPSWAMSSTFAGPEDLDRTTPLSDPTPPRGYSETLYTIVEAMVGRIAAQDRGPLFLRCQNEPYTEWLMGSEDEWRSNVENFERCLRTFGKAARDVAAAPGVKLAVSVSHGGLQRARLIERNILEIGEANPAQRPFLLDLFRSYHERLTGIAFDGWAGLADYTGTDGSRGPANRRAAPFSLDLGQAPCVVVLEM